MKKVLPLILALTILLTACGSKATPTVDAAQVMASAIAMANTIAAQTQAALPTATLVPPTATATIPPPATPTVFALPTFPLSAPTATKASAGPCYSALPSDPTGRKTSLRIVNENKSSVQGSICLYKDMGFGEYGIIGVQLGKKQDTILTVPQGCYSAYFWVNGPPQSTAYGDGMCMNNTDRWTMYIRENVVVLKGP